MTKPLPLFAVIAMTVALLALPAGAAAEYLIPDGNSAVNQYTEGIPTGGGEKDTKGAGEKEVKPAKTIGAETTRKLEEKGPEGKALAEVAAETAPPEAAVESSEGDEPAQKPKHGDARHQGNKADAKGNGKADTGEDAEEAQAGGTVASGSGPSGSGGFGEVLAAATGSSDGGIGLLLPLAIVGAVIWGIVFTVRRRDADETATTHS